MLNKYRPLQRANGFFYWQDNESGKQGSLRTKDRRSAEKHSIRSATSRWSERPRRTCSRSFTTNGHSVAHYLRRLHNLACDLGWLAWPILAKRVWPKIRSERRRAVTTEEHAKIIASEKNPEKRAYYELLYETGAAQSDAAELTAESINWQMA